MTANPTPHEGLSEERERIARIIDPEAWEEYLLEDGRVDQEVASIFQDAYEESLAKADAILSALQALNLDADLSSLQAQSAPFAPGGDVDAWRPIESAPKDGETYILASSNGSAWFQCHWDVEHERWYTFNQYYERDERRNGKVFQPTVWIPLPSQQALSPERSDSDCEVSTDATTIKQEGIPT